MTAPEQYDVVVVGGGPAGHAAAIEAAGSGARVAIVEPEALGGQCVHATCIPATILASTARTFAHGQELAALNVLEMGDRLNLGRSVARRDQLVRALATKVEASLKANGVEVVPGRATLDGQDVTVGGTRRLHSRSIVIATGSRWEPGSVPGVPGDRVVTPDVVFSLTSAPDRTVVVAGGTARTAFSLDAAAPLALAGSSVTVVSEGGRILPWFDEIVDNVARAAFDVLGIAVLTSHVPADIAELGPTMVVLPDHRRPAVDGLGLHTVGLGVSGAIATDPWGRTAVPHVYAAGDVAGGTFLTQSAIRQGRAAGALAIGRELPTVSGAEPHLLHLPEMGWVGLGADEARVSGYDVLVGLIDLTHTPTAVIAGEQEGVLELVVDRELGAVLGGQAVGPGSHESITAIAATMQAEGTVHDLAAQSYWHPSGAESAVDAALSVIRALNR